MSCAGVFVFLPVDLSSVVAVLFHIPTVNVRRARPSAPLPALGVTAGFISAVLLGVCGPVSLWV